MPRISDLTAACLPFVTRSLRGARLRRFGVLSAVIALAAIVAGLWIAQDPGRTARDLRTEMRIEQTLDERQRADFVVFAFDPWELQAYERMRSDVLANGTGPEEDAYRHGGIGRLHAEATIAASWAARGEGMASRLDPHLRALAADAVAEHGNVGAATQRTTPMHMQQDPAWLRLVIDNGLVPTVETYHSPLGLRDTIAVIGLTAGGVLGLLLLLVAPLMVGVQMANEVHENTLQPLTGTALTTRQLLLGMASGPLSVVALLAAPHVATFGLAAATSGRFVTAIGFLLALLAAGLLLVSLAQLVAAGLGKRRSPGMVAVGILVCVGMLGMGALVLGIGVTRNTLGIAATLPGAGAAHLWHATFLPVQRLSWESALFLDLRIVASSVGFVVLGGLSQLAIERRVAARPDGVLRRGEALVGAVVLIALALMAMPHRVDGFGEVYLATLALIAGPLQLFVMSRVPGGDLPPSMRTLPLSRIVAEYAIVLGLHLVVVAVLADAPHASRFSAGAVLHLTWALGVAALVSIRGVAAPASLAAKVWLGVCLLSAMIELGVGAALAADGGRHDLFPLEHAEPLAALIYLGLFLWVPVSLGRSLVKTGCKLG